MTIMTWFVHFGVPGYYEGCWFTTDSDESMVAMAEALNLGQYYAGMKARNG